MKSTARFYLCAHCRIQTLICSACDRGNIYCSVSCSVPARAAYCKVANQRYQNTFKGRQKHAASQARYVARQKKVTDQGSPLPPVNDLLPSSTKKPITCLATCHFCGKACEVAVRHHFLTRQMRQRRRFYRDD